MEKENRISLCGFQIKNGAVFGMQEFTEALEKQEIEVERKNHWMEAEPGEWMVVAGTAADLRIRTLLDGNGVTAPSEPGSLLCRWCETREGKVLALVGADDAGLMYLLLEMARRVKKSGFAAIAEAKDFSEKPENAVRCMDRYIVGHLDNEWFWSEEFWQYYLKRLARGRYNRLCLIVGFDTPYMAPPYPFFLQSVEGYENVHLMKFSPEDVQENLRMLRRVVDLCHSYSMEFVFATWQQRPWTELQDTLVEGLPESEQGLSEYCYAGLKALLKEVPEIDVVSFRVNHESGVGTQISAEDFWNHCADAVADAGEELGKSFVLDLRAKGLTEAMVQHAFSRGLQVEVPTKYWCEHAALPYHITIMRSEELAQLDNYNHSRRYSYADMLQKPLRYPVIYRLWNYGSTNLFLWADADYARRFSKSCSLSGSAGFQVNAPLSLKYGYEQSHREAWKTFADPSLRSGEWEDERFYSWYTMFGRLGYNSNTEPEVWGDEFIEHFGKQAGPIAEQAVAAASKIVPLVTTVHMPVHPSLRYWTEMNTGWALFVQNNLNKMQTYDFDTTITYGSTEPSDHGLFYGIDEFAADSVRGTVQGKYTPLQYADMLDRLADQAERLAASLPREEENEQKAEYRAMLVDISMLVDFGRYHAEKIRAALALAYWNETKDAGRLSDSALHLRRAIAEWEKLGEAGRKYYYHDLDFSTAGSETRRGTWGDLTCELRADLETLEQLLKDHAVNETEEAVYSYHAETVPELYAELPETAVAGEPLRIRVQVTEEKPLKTYPVLHYRHVNQTEGVFREIPMQPDKEGYTAEIPADYITKDWDLMVYVTLQDVEGSCSLFPGLYHSAYPWPYHVITVKK